MKQRHDDYEKRSIHLKPYSDEELKAYFYRLIDQLVDPLLSMAYENTTPAIERSVLMRMGFSSIEAKSITDLIFEQDLLAYGAGHIVYIYAKEKQLSIREAGLQLLDTNDWAFIKEVIKHD
jgi:D-ornithine 4,5-aminomutase subunit alpha